jgi:serine protease inhibitor
MLVAVPKQVDGLRSIEDSLSGQVWRGWMNALSSAAPVTAHVYLPRFRLEEKWDLRSPLCSMGASDLFDDLKADLRWVTDEKPGVFLNTLEQHAGIITDEKGSEAWSVTHGEFISMGGPPTAPPVRVFRADRPFLFFVYGGVRNTVLFMGRVTFSQPVVP